MRTLRLEASRRTDRGGGHHAPERGAGGLRRQPLRRLRRISRSAEGRLWRRRPAAGGAPLERKKGYRVPPLALAGGAATVFDPGLLEATLHRVLHDEAIRVNLMRCFDDYFSVHECTAGPLLKAVTAFAGVK